MKHVKTWTLAFIFAFVLLFTLQIANASDVTLAWDASPSPNVDGYMIYYGQEADNLQYNLDAGPVLTTTVKGLTPGTWYFEATAYNVLGESERSNRADKTIAAFTVPPDNKHVPLSIPVAPGGSVRITIDVTQQ